MKIFSFKTLLSILVLLSVSLAFSSPSDAARKARGEVNATVEAGGDPCQALSSFLKKSQKCSADELAGKPAIVVVQSEKKITVKKDQPVILKAGEAGKTTGRVIQLIDLPADMDQLKEAMKEKKRLVLWGMENDKKLLIIEPDKDFMPEKGQRVKLKVKEVTKVEGC